MRYQVFWIEQTDRGEVFPRIWADFLKFMWFFSCLSESSFCKILDCFFLSRFFFRFFLRGRLELVEIYKYFFSEKMDVFFAYICIYKNCIFAWGKSQCFDLQLFGQLRSFCECPRLAFGEESTLQSFVGRSALMVAFRCAMQKWNKFFRILHSRRPVWVEILCRRQRRPRGGIFGRAEKLLFSAGLHVFFVCRV